MSCKDPLISDRKLLDISHEQGVREKPVKSPSTHARRFPDRSPKAELLFIFHSLPFIRQENAPPKRNKEETFKTQIERFLAFKPKNRSQKNAVNKKRAICSNRAGKCYTLHLSVHQSPTEKWVRGRASLPVSRAGKIDPKNRGFFARHRPNNQS